MPPRLYKMTVLGGAITWMMFGLSLGMILRRIEGDTPIDALEIVLAVVWLAMGVLNVWWLLDFGKTRSRPPAP